MSDKLVIVALDVFIPPALIQPPVTQDEVDAMGFLIPHKSDRSRFIQCDLNRNTL